MAKHDEYNLAFNQALLSNGTTRRHVFSTTENNQYEPLTFLNALEQCEMHYFVDSILLANNGQLYDPNFYKQQGTEAFAISFTEPDFNIEGLVINMLDLQQLITEWIMFLNSKL